MALRALLKSKAQLAQTEAVDPLCSDVWDVGGNEYVNVVSSLSSVTLLRCDPLVPLFKLR